MENEQAVLPTSTVNEKAVEQNQILSVAAAALRALAGFGAAIVPGRKTQSLQVIAPSGSQYTLKLK